MSGPGPGSVDREAPSHTGRVSECWVFYAVPTARVIFTTKTSLDVFSLNLVENKFGIFQSWVIESMR